MYTTEDLYIEHLEKSFKNAEAGNSKITGEILEMYGMTGHKTRHLYNNLLNIGDSRYLEVGTWAGSSVCAAMYNNTSTVVCIDNWSEFGGADVKEIFFEYFNELKGANDASFIEADCFKLNIDDLIKFNIYLYDGGHSYEDHYKALEYYLPCLDDLFIFIIDDWNWEKVRNGTNDSIMDFKLEVLWKKEIILTTNDEHTPLDEAKQNWWNGIAVFLLKKRCIK
ncbi:MAG: hypothetical protein JWN56_1000 [Sphingobacteriales bacterium]|nr:hypothetical protein [Sphingobacteriales bacterium]